MVCLSCVASCRLVRKKRDNFRFVTYLTACTHRLESRAEQFLTLSRTFNTSIIYINPKLSVYFGPNADIGLKTTTQCEPIYEARGQRIVVDAAEDGCTDRLPRHMFVQTPHYICRSSHTGLRLHAGTHVAYPDPKLKSRQHPISDA